MSEWQPIETAPKDGTRFLAFDPRRDLAPCLIVHYWHRFWMCDDERSWCPTHWQHLPLPPPPEVK